MKPINKPQPQKPTIQRRTPVATAKPVANGADEDDDDDFDPEDIDDEDDEDDDDFEPQPVRNPGGRNLPAARAQALATANKAKPAPALATKAAPKAATNVKSQVTELKESVGAVDDGADTISSTDIGTGDLFAGLINKLTEGQAITITRLSANSCTITIGTAVVSSAGQTAKRKAKMTYDQWTKEVYSEEYQEHVKLWEGLTEAQKLKMVKDAGVAFKAEADKRVHLMNATMAYRASLGFGGDGKYKPDYQDKAAREAIR